MPPGMILFQASNLLPFHRRQSLQTRAIAAALLPFAITPVHYSTTDHVVNLRCGMGLHPGHHMRVQVERNADLRMSKTLTRDLWMDAAGQQLRCMGVAQVVEAHPRVGPLGRHSKVTAPILSTLGGLPKTFVVDELV